MIETSLNQGGNQLKYIIKKELSEKEIREIRIVFFTELDEFLKPSMEKGGGLQGVLDKLAEYDKSLVTGIFSIVSLLVYYILDLRKTKSLT